MAHEDHTAVDNYFDAALLHPHPALAHIRAANTAAHLPDIDVAPNQGKLLALLVRACGARRVLEVGTLGGYSTAWLADAVGPAGTVITIEINPHHADTARANLHQAGHTNVDIRTGPALDILPSLTGGFGFAFIDADKQHSADYFRLAVELVVPGGLIVVDNVVRAGAVTNPHDTDPNVTGTRALIDVVATEERVHATTLQTVGRKGWDGFLIALRR
ncbi:O-methyltransferase [Actinokineospora guangxiensis]|uniref:O-methyltransferase n=1 Tax=Actinokineospora guangxiensis TaxID=1490288 RepID=A0ABW0ER66_9PSEU